MDEDERPIRLELEEGAGPFPAIIVLMFLTSIAVFLVIAFAAGSLN